MEIFTGNRGTAGKVKSDKKMQYEFVLRTDKEISREKGNLELEELLKKIDSIVVRQIK